ARSLDRPDAEQPRSRMAEGVEGKESSNHGQHGGHGVTSIAVETRPTFGAVTRDYMELSKSRIVLMVLITTAAGYLFAATKVDPLLLLHALIGTALVAAGTNALNQYVEREYDAQMN